LEVLSDSVQLRIVGKLQAFSGGLKTKSAAIKRLHGFPFPAYRLRIGDYRAVFALESEKIVVVRIVNRKELERALAAMRQQN
jgi:mRNA-degrading endonuclease RelE of RelBE toxin-antitoxin system